MTRIVVPIHPLGLENSRMLKMKPMKRDNLFALIAGTLSAGAICGGGCSLPSGLRLPFSQPAAVNAEADEDSSRFREVSFRPRNPKNLRALGVPVVSEIMTDQKPARSQVSASETKQAQPQQRQADPPQSQEAMAVLQTEAAVALMAKEIAELPALPELTELGPADHVVLPAETLTEPIRDERGIELDLVSALAAIGGQHPAVGLARWRVEEAYARWSQAKILWIPTLQAGMSFHRHDGNYQASNADIVDVSRSSLQTGLGVGATGAGTTPRPGLVAQYHLADAIFQPDITQKQAWAAQHSAHGVNQRQLMDASVDYLQWLAAHLDHQILQESRQRTADLAKLTGDFAATGQGLQADADRLNTELAFIDNRLLQADEQIEVRGAQLVQTLSLSHSQPMVPRDPTIAPIEFVAQGTDRAELIATALGSRPELRESRAMVAAACAAHRRQKWAPFVPSVLLGFSTGSFGGGLGNNVDNVDGRYDFDASVAWQARQLGLGEVAARRESASQVQQARFESARVMDQVAREVSEFHSQTQFRAKRIELSKRAIQSAKDSYQRDLSRIREGQGLPIETLQSLQALEQAQRNYLNSVVDYNQAQFQLQWAIGWSVIETPQPMITESSD
ncbi:MAG: TolC family protein [Rubripirellula sp.]|nr:TolC family protein [Rubripirellula sp.]